MGSLFSAPPGCHLAPRDADSGDGGVRVAIIRRFQVMDRSFVAPERRADDGLETILGREVANGLHWAEGAIEYSSACPISIKL